MIVIQPEGLGEAAALLKMIAKIGQIRPYVEYRGTQRTKESFNNAELLHWHALEGRDVVSMKEGSPELQRLQENVLKVVENGIKREQKRGLLKVTDKGKILGTDTIVKHKVRQNKLLEMVYGAEYKDIAAEQVARAIVARAFKKAAQEWKLEISERIREQRDADGNTIRDLSEAYKPIKLKKHKFERPVLVATGDLLDSITGNMQGIRYKEQGK